MAKRTAPDLEADGNPTPLRGVITGSTIKETDMKQIIGGVLVALFALSLTACNTVRGVGQDVENAGETVQDAAS